MFLFKYLTNKFKPEKRDDGLEYADFSQRYLSLLFDFVIMIFILKFIYSGMFFISSIIPNDIKTKFNSEVLYKNKFNMELTQEEKKEMKSIKNKYLIIQGLSFFIAFLYVIFTLYYFGGTFGNLILGFRILEEKNTGKLHLMTCFIRLLGIILTFLTLFIGFFNIFFNKKKQSLYDKLSKTIAIKNSSIIRLIESKQKNQEDFVRIDPINSFLRPFLKTIFIRTLKKEK